MKILEIFFSNMIFSHKQHFSILIFKILNL